MTILVMYGSNNTIDIGPTQERLVHAKDGTACLVYATVDTYSYTLLNKYAIFRLIIFLCNELLIDHINDIKLDKL